MRLSIELIGRYRQRKKPTGRRIFLYLVGLPIAVVGVILAISACRSSDPVPGISADDDNLIRAHLREIAPPPAMVLRVRNAIQVFRTNVMPINDAPETITGLMIGPGGILINTQSHGIHIYDRDTKTWNTLDDSDPTSDSTNNQPSVETDSDDSMMGAVIRWSSERHYSFVTNSIKDGLTLAAIFFENPGKEPTCCCLFASNPEHNTLTMTAWISPAIPAGMETAAVLWTTLANAIETMGFYGIDPTERKVWFRLSLYRPNGHLEPDELDYLLENAITAMHCANSFLTHDGDHDSAEGEGDSHPEDHVSLASVAFTYRPRINPTCPRSVRNGHANALPRSGGQRFQLSSLSKWKNQDSVHR